MDRRDFFKCMAAAGAGVAIAAPWLRGVARADCPRTTAPYDGPLWVVVNAPGAWDPMYLCDPKTNLHRVYPGPIGRAGALSYAPIAGLADFFNAYAARLTVINGVTCDTNNHDIGTRYFASGKLSLSDHHPAFAALVASAAAGQVAMPFVTYGGYDYAAGVVVPTRAGTGDSLRSLLAPERVTGTQWRSGAFPDGPPERYHTAAEDARLDAYREARRQGRLASRPLARESAALATLFASRLSGDELRKLDCFLPTTTDPDETRAQMQTVIAAYRAGITASVAFSVSYFDTHADHDRLHVPAMQDLVAFLGKVLAVASETGVLDRVGLVVGSDFGRTPQYNDAQGTDHWPVTSMLAMLPGGHGGRVVGATNDSFEALPVNPSDPQQTDSSGRGVTLTPAIVHQALRRTAGIQASAQAQQFPLDAAMDLPLFG